MGICRCFAGSVMRGVECLLMVSEEHAVERDVLRDKYALLSRHLDERGRRLWAGAEALAFGYGGITLVHHATGLSRLTIAGGIAELQSEDSASDVLEAGRVRRSGGGRKTLESKDPALVSALESLVDPVSRGDPESPLRWVSKSLRKLSMALGKLGHTISAPKVAGLLRAQGYSLQANRKTKEGSQHPDRDAQFAFVSEQTKAWQAKGQPVISVDCKKKELVGDFKNPGVEWQPQGEPEEVRVYDFMDRDLLKASGNIRKAIPYGVYDIDKNEGWVSVGCDHDTAQFAAATIYRWWEQRGKPLYPHATDLMLCADGGGSNGSRSRLWKASLQEFADKTKLNLHVCHFPPGTSKWNKIEHRLFSHITMNWRGRPLVSLEVIVNLIASTTTKKGLKVQAELDQNTYPTKIRVSDKHMLTLNLHKHDFHGEWNYTIKPRQQESQEKE